MLFRSVANYAVVGAREYVRLGIIVDGDDCFCGADSRQVLDRAGDADGSAQAETVADAPVLAWPVLAGDAPKADRPLRWLGFKSVSVMAAACNLLGVCVLGGDSGLHVVW